jgi:hypothetical protein
VEQNNRQPGENGNQTGSSQGKFKMRNRFTASTLGMVATCALSAAAMAQAPKSTGAVGQQKAMPTADLSGVWVEYGVPGSGTKAITGFGNKRFRVEDPPLQPWAQEIFNKNRQGLKNPNEAGHDELNPRVSCYPSGPTAAFVLPRPFLIVQTPEIVILNTEWDHSVRRIYTDGRDHPAGYPLGWMGHSIGKWDGDALVVDTIDIRPETWLDDIGTPHSDQLHIVERYRRPNRETLEIEFLFDDPKTFTKPWGGKKIFLLRSDWEVMDHVNCEEYLHMKTPHEISDYAK